MAREPFGTILKARKRRRRFRLRSISCLSKGAGQRPTLQCGQLAEDEGEDSAVAEVLRFLGRVDARYGFEIDLRSIGRNSLHFDPRSGLDRFPNAGDMEEFLSG